MEIQNLAFFQNRDTTKTEVQVYGTPYHCTQAELIERYKKLSLEDFLEQEARHGIGNYAIVDFNHLTTRVITSTAYCGGYFHEDSTGVRVGTTLKSVLPEKPIFDEFGLCFFLTPHPKTAFSQMPLSTVFKNVYRIPPASVFEFSEGVKTNSYLYLSYGRRTAPPVSFEDALWEVAQKMSDSFKDKNIKPILFFSGGADCLVLYLALAHLMGKDNIRVITMQTLGKRSKSNGHERAVPVARNCGMKIEILPDNSLTSPNVAKLVASMMSKDMIGSVSPHLALEDCDANVPIIHGQNMDAVALNTMDAIQFNLEKGYLTDAILPKVSEKTELKQYKAFINNLVNTAEFLSETDFQKTSAKSFAKQFGGIPDPEPGGKGILRGLLTSQYPNVLPYPKRPASHCKMLDAANREVELYKDFVSEIDLVGQRTADVARFCTYSAIASKRLTTFSISSGSRPELLAMSGPITSYFIGKNKSMLEASQPKREIYDFIKKMTGKNYSELVVQNSEDRILLDELDISVRNGDKLLTDYSADLKVDKLKILDCIEDERIKSNITKLFQEKIGKAPGFERQILNLELLLLSHQEDNEFTNPSQNAKKKIP